MPIIITPDGPEWVPDTNCEHGISFGDRNTQDYKLEERRKGTIISTARVIKYLRDGIMTEADVRAGIELNASAVGLEPSKLLQLAQQYLQYQEGLKGIDSNGMENGMEKE